MFALHTPEAVVAAEANGMKSATKDAIKKRIITKKFTYNASALKLRRRLGYV